MYKQVPTNFLPIWIDDIFNRMFQVGNRNKPISIENVYDQMI